MNSVDLLVENLIAQYPSIFGSRTSVLHHLFLVLGNGFEWHKGKLVDKYKESVADKIPRETAKLIAKLTHHIDDPYPWCDLCKLATMPESALPEWRLAAEEIKSAVDESYFTK